MIDPSLLPELPGCYLFQDAEGVTLYIGKAKNLKKRVSSYVQPGAKIQKTRCLVQATASTDFIVTDTEVEALILENTLIKKHQPKYNIDLKDSKNYAYIRISDDVFPRIGIARKAAGGGEFFGPFVSARERDHVLSAVRKTFGLRSCRRLPKRACLRYHIGTCAAPCNGGITETAYQERVQDAKSLLKGHGDALVRTLRREMEEKSGNLEYEGAMGIRDRIAAIERLSERQHMDRRKTYDEDVLHYIAHEDRIYLMLFHVSKGTLVDKQEFVFDEWEESFEEFLVQYYGEHAPPREVIIPHAVDPSVNEFLSGQRGGKVTVTIPQRGDKKNLLDLVKKNIEIAFFGNPLKVKCLQEALRLPDPPKVIECFDISHFSGSAMVGAMVRFRNGVPDKGSYRRFRIRTVDGIDDFAAIAEIVRRRYSRLKRENGEFPDLVIIDGGRGQLSYARRELDRLRLKIPVISIAKGEEEIYIPGFPLPLRIDPGDPASLFIQEIRDEAHRFAVTYHRTLRRRSVIP